VIAAVLKLFKINLKQTREVDFYRSLSIDFFGFAIALNRFNIAFKRAIGLACYNKTFRALLTTTRSSKDELFGQ
jgi:hypothetical protein